LVHFAGMISSYKFTHGMLHPLSHKNSLFC
jgi:hypothetical protein